jgi:hypothetical protein
MDLLQTLLDVGSSAGGAEKYLFLPLVWPHGIIGHLGETFGSFTAFTALTLKLHPHQITPVILLFDPLIAHSNYIVTGFKNLVSYR